MEKLVLRRQKESLARHFVWEGGVILLVCR